MLQSWIKGSKFRSWATRPDGPPVLRECKTIFEKMNGVVPDTLPDSDSFVENTIQGHPVSRLLGMSKVASTATIRHNGVYFSRFSQHVGNSHVMVSRPGSLRPYPARIVWIYTADDKIQLAIQRQKEAPRGIWSNLSRRFCDVPIKLYSAEFHTALQSINLSDVASHYARWDIGGHANLSFVLDLSKVTFPLSHSLASCADVFLPCALLC